MNKQEAQTKYVGGGAGFLALLTLLFIHHKLIGTIAWSWWWVLAPLWVPLVVAIVVVVIISILVYKN
jgi:uncharacterized protein (DUF983 family)